MAFCLALASGCGPDYPSCDNDDQCHEHEFCVNHQCQQCRSDADCPAGQSCSDGACAPIDGYCDATTACPGGQECVDNRCRAVATPESSCAAVTCPTGTRCENGQCIPNPFEASCTPESVYFDYDSDALDEANRRSLQAAQRCIAESHPASVHATGHADERGTEEYNLALSERRAQTVMRYLQTLGVSVELSASGMGEEMATGTTEEAWRHDRRVDLHQR